MKVKAKIASAVAAVTAYLAAAPAVLAQYDYTYDYTYDDDVAGGVGVVMMIVWCCSALFGLANLAIVIWMLVHAIQNAPEDKKVLWILLILFVPFAAWVYFFTKRKEWGPAKSSSKK